MENKDAKELEHILDVIGKKIPHLFNTLRDVIYSPEAAKNLGKSTALFYKELKEGGLDDEEAFKLTQDYLAALKNIGNAGNNINMNKGGVSGEYQTWKSKEENE